MFPAVDPIPLPAPIWLFKLLHVVTLALHFTAMQLMVGGLVLAAIWALIGRAKKDPVMNTASGALINRVPAVMTYVINFGVPPLLFAQVLYGRALYTSSVLMGVYWISVIVILTFAYWFLYICAKRAKDGKSWGWLALISALLIFKIAAIYASNMTLMLRPDVWQDMYRSDPMGLQMNSGDPTMLPRLFFMLAGGLTVGGAGMALLGTKKTLADGAGEFLGAWGGRLAALGILAQVGLGYWVLQTQPQGVVSALTSKQLFHISELGWLATALLLLAAGLFVGFSPAGRKFLPVAGLGLIAFLNVALMTLFRDGLRDQTLLAHGYDVWDRTVVTNWSVVGIFLFLFVAGVGVVLWLASVVARAKQEVESYA